MTMAGTTREGRVRRITAVVAVLQGVSTLVGFVELLLVPQWFASQLEGTFFAGRQQLVAVPRRARRRLPVGGALAPGAGLALVRPRPCCGRAGHDLLDRRRMPRHRLLRLAARAVGRTGRDPAAARVRPPRGAARPQPWARILLAGGRAPMIVPRIAAPAVARAPGSVTHSLRNMIDY